MVSLVIKDMYFKFWCSIGWKKWRKGLALELVFTGWFLRMFLKVEFTVQRIETGCIFHDQAKLQLILWNEYSLGTRIYSATKSMPTLGECKLRNPKPLTTHIGARQRHQEVFLKIQMYADWVSNLRGRFKKKLKLPRLTIPAEPGLRRSLLECRRRIER